MYVCITQAGLFIDNRASCTSAKHIYISYPSINLYWLVHLLHQWERQFIKNDLIEET